jgi:hypothetical protein
MDKVKLFFKEASTKVTTYVALAIAGLAQAAEHVEDLYAMVPTLQQYLPESHYVHTGMHYAMSGLGFAVVVLRVRRALWPPKP